MYERIQKLLHEKEMTQRELAERINETEAKVARCVSGERIAGIGFYVKVAEALGVSIEFLIGGTE